jgi:hypothetical protein
VSILNNLWVLRTSGYIDVIGRFDLAALRGCHTLKERLFVCIFTSG